MTPTGSGDSWNMGNYKYCEEKCFLRNLYSTALTVHTDDDDHAILRGFLAIKVIVIIVKCPIKKKIIA